MKFLSSSLRGTSHDTRRFRHTRLSGFSLIEMLVVIAIIVTLMGMLLAGVDLAKNRARRSLAQTEVGQIADAWTLYYSEYQRWPPPLDAGGSHAIRGPVAEILSAGTYSPANPRSIRFCQFSKVHEDDSSGVLTILNPWGMEEEPLPPAEWLYYVAVDHDYNGRIEGPSGTVTGRTAIVWTADPGFDGDDDVDDEGEIIGSWKQ